MDKKHSQFQEVATFHFVAFEGMDRKEQADVALISFNERVTKHLQY